MNTLLSDSADTEVRRTRIVRRDPRDPRRSPADGSRRGQGREEPRHQGDGGGAPRRDDERAARCPGHQRRAGRALAARGARRAASWTAKRTARCILDPSGAVSAHFEEIDAHAGASRIPILFCGPLLHLPRRGAHPRPRRLPHRRPADRLPHGRAARVRRDRRQDATRASASPRPNGLHGREDRAAVPERRRDRAGAAHRRASAKGVTELRGAAIEPEIMDLIAVLQKMGAIISYEPNRVILIEGVDTLQRLRPPLHLRPQRGRLAGRARRSRPTATSSSAAPSSRRCSRSSTSSARSAARSTSTRTASASAAAARSSPSIVETDVHPGFMTDWQQPLIVALTQAEGVSIVHETVYENRFGFTEALVRDGRRHRRAPEGIDSPRPAGSAPRSSSRRP